MQARALPFPREKIKSKSKEYRKVVLLGGRLLIDVTSVISNLSSTSRTSCQTLALQFPQVYSPTETRETTQHSGGKNKHVMASDHTSLSSFSVTHSPFQRDKSNLSTPSTWPWGQGWGVGVGRRGWGGGEVGEETLKRTKAKVDHLVSRFGLAVRR